MTTRQKYILVVLAGWIVPMVCIIAGRGAITISCVAVSIAWWHGYMARRLESKLECEKKSKTGLTGVSRFERAL